MKKDTQKHIRTGLTLTWDVLKLTTTFSTDISVIGLTLTWDVLK